MTAAHELWQPDLFAETSAPTLNIARISDTNPRIYAHEDCHAEEIRLDKNHRLEMLFAYTEDGWKKATGYYTPNQGSFSPVFVRSEAYQDFYGAKNAAIRCLARSINSMQLAKVIPGATAVAFREQLKRIAQ